MRHSFLCLSLLGLACLSFLAPVRAQSSAPAINEIDLDFRTRYDSYSATGSRLAALTLRNETPLAPGVRFRVYAAHRYGLDAAQEAVVEKDWGGTAGRVDAGLVRVPFGIYDPRETYASGLIDYPMTRGDYAYHSVDWGAPGVFWSGGPANLQIEAAGFGGKGTGIWDNASEVSGGAVRAQTSLSSDRLGSAILGLSRWDGTLHDKNTSLVSRPVHMTGLDLRYTRNELLLRGEYLFGTLAGSQDRGWYLDTYYRLPRQQRWTLVARVEALKPDDRFAESRQLTLGVRAVLSPDWTLAANWRTNNGHSYGPNWTLSAPGRGDIFLQAFRRVRW